MSRVKTVQAKDISDLAILSLIAAHDADHSKPFAYEVLLDAGYPAKVVYAKYDKLDNRGFIEAGVTTRTAWLTYEGKAELLRLHAKYVIDQAG